MRPRHCWRTHGRKFYFHRANLEYRKTVVASIAVADAKVTADRAFAIEPEDLGTYVDEDQSEFFQAQGDRASSHSRAAARAVRAGAIELDVEYV